jgi:hypothetical protein
VHNPLDAFVVFNAEGSMEVTYENMPASLVLIDLAKRARLLGIPIRVGRADYGPSITINPTYWTYANAFENIRTLTGGILYLELKFTPMLQVHEMILYYISKDE